MADLPETTGTLTVLQNLRVLKLQIAPQPRAAEVYLDISGHSDRLTAEHQSFQGVWDQQVANTAELGYLTELLREEVSKVNRRVLVELDGDRGDPRFIAVFPTNPSEAMQGVADDAMAAYVEGVLAAIAADAALAISVPTTGLRAAADNVAAARDRRAALAAQVSEARGRLKATKLAAIAAHNLAKPRLLALFDNDLRRVRSFFYTKARGEKTPDQE